MANPITDPTLLALLPTPPSSTIPHDEEGEGFPEARLSFLPTRVHPRVRDDLPEAEALAEVRRHSITNARYLLHPDTPLAPRDRVSVTTLGLKLSGLMVDKVEVSHTLSLQTLRPILPTPDVIEARFVPHAPGAPDGANGATGTPGGGGGETGTSQE